MLLPLSEHLVSAVSALAGIASVATASTAEADGFNSREVAASVKKDARREVFMGCLSLL